MRCARCKVKFYCSRDHQTADFPAHKSACSAVAKKRTALENAEQKARTGPGDFPYLPANAFDSADRAFWSRPEARDYIRERTAFIDALDKVNTYDAVDAQLEHVMGLLRLYRGENMRLRHWAPSLMLRLNRDQECYDFLKFWIKLADDDYDPGNMNRYLNIKNANAFERDPVELTGLFTPLAHITTFTLLKVKLLLDLMALQNSADVAPLQNVPPEIVDSILSFVPQSPIVANNRALLERQDHTKDIRQLDSQINMLHGVTQNINPYFWHVLFNPEDLLTKPLPQNPTSRSLEEALETLHYSYRAWVETPGALDLVKANAKNGKWPLFMWPFK